MLKRYIVKRYKYNPYAVPFYVEDLSGNGGTLSIYTSLSDATDIEYSTDAKTWSSTNPGVPAGGRVYMRANATYWSTSPNTTTARISCSSLHQIGGNIMSLMYGSSFDGTQDTFINPNKQHIFERMFSYDANLVSAGDLLLPAMTLTWDTYNYMFSHCTALTTAPELPATDIYTGSYHAMFEYCSALVNPPSAMPATIYHGSGSNYAEMFDQCTSLTHTPVISGSPTQAWGWTNMFRGCSSLNTITVESTQWGSGNQISNWVQGVAATGTFYKPADTSIPVGSNGIPNANWTVINQ